MTTDGMVLTPGALVIVFMAPFVVRLTPNLFRLFRRSPVTRSCRSDVSLADQKLQIARETGRVTLTTRTEFHAKTLPASL